MDLQSIILDKPKFKKAFELFVLNNFDAGHNLNNRLTIRLSNKIVRFYKLHSSMQYGVLIDFFKSENIFFGKEEIEYNTYWVTYHDKTTTEEISSDNLTREESLERAIEIFESK